jgi:prepilin-type N-terminal cleavage/methylation domain-containing protein
MKFIRQKGFTLIELLVALPIGTAILLVVVASLFQIERGRIEISGKSAALADIDSAMHWLSRDLILAQTTDLSPGAPPVAEMEMNWTDMTSWAGDNGSIYHSANYYLNGTRLIRDYDGEVTIIGRYVTHIGFSIDSNAKVFTVDITSSPGMPGSAVTREMDIQIRSDL